MTRIHLGDGEAVVRFVHDKVNKIRHGIGSFIRIQLNLKGAADRFAIFTVILIFRIDGYSYKRIFIAVIDASRELY